MTHHNHHNRLILAGIVNNDEIYNKQHSHDTEIYFKHFGALLIKKRTDYY